jgi:hypothetical protein
MLSAGVIMLSPATQYFEYSQLRHQYVSQDSVGRKCSETHYSQYSIGQQFVNTILALNLKQSYSLVLYSLSE